MELCLHKILSRRSFGVEFHNIASFGWRLSFSPCKGARYENCMDGIQIFKNESFGEVRVAGTSEEPLFCLADICKVVELTNPSSIKSRLEKEDVQMIDLHALNPDMGIVLFYQSCLLAVFQS